ncbi:MAG: D-alanyl-D-alanine carboxypeptidase family protein [Actinomycetota bacterium]
MRRRPAAGRVAVVLGVLAALLVLPVVAGAQDAADRPDLPGAQAAILIDARDGGVMFQRDPDERRSIASTTKLMTALLTLERAKPGDVYRAPAYSALPAESKIDLRAGERMRVDDLLEALLLESANDAAVTLAQGVSGSRPAFVRDMNARARELGLTGTSYANPIGLDDPDNYSTARDLAALARRLMRNRRFASIVDMPAANLESGTRPRALDNRNDLVGRYDFVDGVKTGHTGTAGYVLVGAAGGPLGARVISVVLGEPSETARDTESLALLRYGLAQFHRVQPLNESKPVATAAVKHFDERASLVPENDALVVARRGQRVRTSVDAPEELEGELPAGHPVGRITVLRGDQVVRRVRLVTATEVPGAGPLRVVVDTLGIALLPLLAALALLVAALVVVLRRRHPPETGTRRGDRDARRRDRDRARPS